jgi:hypothetical protein
MTSIALLSGCAGGGTPKVRPNSFWFAPEMPNGVQYLPNDQRRHTIDLKDSTLVLTAKDGNWEVVRNAS